MTPEAQQIAIAEACKWRHCRLQASWLVGHHPGRIIPNEPAVEFMEPLPDYLNDLNAMHEAEETLKPARLPKSGEYASREYGQFVQALCRVCEDYEVSVFHASAAQRAEAFLKTIGKWVQE